MLLWICSREAGRGACRKSQGHSVATDDYEFIFRSYRFLDAAIKDHGHAMTGPDRDKLTVERAVTFQKLLTQPSQDPKITLLQLKSLVECLRTPSDDREISTLVADACQSHLCRLADILDDARGPKVRRRASPASEDVVASLDPDKLSILDVSSDRICILDTKYRYRYVNGAQAKFHQVAPSAFVGKSNWDVVSEPFFAKFMKPIFDRCFEGEPVDMITYHPERAPDFVYQCRFDPIRNGEGKTVALLASCRGLPPDTLLKSAAIVCPGAPIGTSA